MPFWRQILPASTRVFLRRQFDRPFCRRDGRLRRLGGTNAWSVLETRLGAGAAVLSGGVGRDISFELELAGIRQCRVAVFDPSPTGRETVAELPAVPATLRYFPLGLAGRSSPFAFAAPADPAEGSFSTGARRPGQARFEFECLGPADALERAELGEVELLKLDIEGFEYEFLDAMLGAGIRPAQIAVEYHHFLPGISIFRTLASIRRLIGEGYRIMHKDQCDYLFVHRSALGA
jgi:FkbM family methyltransferase